MSLRCGHLLLLHQVRERIEPFRLRYASSLSTTLEAQAPGWVSAVTVFLLISSCLALGLECAWRDFAKLSRRSRTTARCDHGELHSKPQQMR